jgi:hypothetical protein
MELQLIPAAVAERQTCVRLTGSNINDNLKYKARTSLTHYTVRLQTLEMSISMP